MISRAHYDHTSVGFSLWRPTGRLLVSSSAAYVFYMNTFFILISKILFVFLLYFCYICAMY